MANTLTFANDTLTDANIFGGINYTVDLNTGDEFSIGNTASACVSFVTDTRLPLYSKDQTNGTFVWDVDGTDKGRFYITEVKKVDSGYEIEAYDAMSLLDTSVTALSISLPVTVSAAASAIAAYIGCTVSGTIINGSMEAQDGTIDDTTTIRQLLSWVAEASGCSVKIDAADHICFMYYADSGITITASDYKEQGLAVADYNCAAIDNVTICDMAGMTAASAGSGTNSLFIQGNPFMYEATSTEAAAILAVVEDFEYAPLTCEMFDEEGLEVGVTATFGTATTLVMHLESSEDGVTVSSVGSDSRAELNKSLDIIVNEAMAVASDAQQTAQELNLHFWYTATGSEAGAHIAEVDKPTFETNPTGGNLLSNSTGIAVRDGLTELATFGANSARVGTNGKASIYISPDTLTGYGDGGSEFFNFSNSQASIEVQKMETIAIDVPFNQIPSTDDSGYSVTLPYTPTSSTEVVAEFGLRRTSGVWYTYWFVTFTAGTASTQQASYTYNGNTYVVSATYDGNKTISGFKMTPQSADTSLYAEIVGIEYRTTALAPCYEVGGDLTASGAYAFAHGMSNTASGNYSSVGGFTCTASGNYSHAEGYNCTASGNYSFAEGNYARATNTYARAEGYGTVASGLCSYAVGAYTTASGNYQTVIGRQNIADTTSLFIIGNGTVGGTASNAFKVGSDGTVTIPNGAHLRLNDNAGSQYSWTEIYASTVSDTSNLYLQADGYMGFYVGNTTTAPTGRMYLYYDRLEVFGYIRARAGFYANNNQYYRCSNTGGTDRILCGINNNNDYFFGYGSYAGNEGTVYFDGNAIYIRSKTGIAVTGTSFRPSSANAVPCGSTSYYWTRFYANTAEWVKSDRKTKDVLGSLDFSKDLIMGLRPVQFMLKDSDHRRIHMGFIAQEADAVAKRLDKNLSFIIADYIDEEKGEYLGEEVDDEELTWGLSYTELIAPTIKVVQDQQKELDVLKAEVEELRRRLS